MIRVRLYLCLTVLFVLSCSKSSDRQYQYLSPQEIISDPALKKLYIACTTADRIAVFDIEKQTITKRISVPKPAGLKISPDGKTLYVTSAEAEGKVHLIDTSSGKIRTSISVGHTPVSIAVHHQGNKLYVCNMFSDSVSVVDLTKQKEIARIAMPREPVDMLMANGKLFVANSLPAGRSDKGVVAATVSVIDIQNNVREKNIQLPNGSTTLKGICVSPDGRYVYVTHILARYQMPTTQLERGWVNTNALSIIDTEKCQWVNTVLLDEIDRGAANPWVVGCSNDSKYICVSLAGTHEVSIIDRPALHKKLDAQNISGINVPDDLSFLVGICKKVSLGGNGPRGFVIVGSRAFVTEYFSDSLSIVDIESKKLEQHIALSSKIQASDARKGEILFNDAAECFQKWQSCASCHPGSGRVDGLNWDLLNDGIGNPKNTKSLLFSHRTGPAMVTGVRKDAETAVRAGIRHIHFASFESRKAKAIDQYLKSLKPLPSPYLVKGSYSQAAVRGKEVFQQANCGSCHSGPLYTDNEKYDVGTGIGKETGREFDTPTLIELWRTGPWLYNGEASTMLEVLTKYNPDDRHGKTSDLSEQQLNDLAEFLLSL